MRQSLHVVVACVAFCLTVGGIVDGANAIGAAPEIVFEPPKAVVVRQTNGSPARGELLRIDSDALWLKAINGSEVKLKLERVRSIKTSDESFEYWPSKESFDELADRISKVPGATLTGTRTGATTKSQARTRQGTAADSNQTDPDDIEARKERNRQARDRRGDGNDDDDRPGTNPFSTETPLKLPATERDDAGSTAVADASSTDSDEPSNSSSSSAEPGTVILTCSNCNEELPAGFVSGDACPHCGKVATYEVEETNPLANGGAASTAPQNPFAAPGGVAPTAAMPAVTPAAPTAATAPAGGQGMSMANIPLLGKIGIFAGFIIVGWLILQRR